MQNLEPPKMRAIMIFMLRSLAYFIGYGYLKLHIFSCK